ncbi:hypothetical protein SDJN03_13218, partial [Cucurbita argyrosperma subsp. sororia]
MRISVREKAASFAVKSPLVGSHGDWVWGIGAIIGSVFDYLVEMVLFFLFFTDSGCSAFCGALKNLLFLATDHKDT